MFTTPRRPIIVLSWSPPLALIALSLLAAPYLPQEWWLPIPSSGARPGDTAIELTERRMAAVAEAPTEALADLQTNDFGMLLLVDEPPNDPQLTWAPWPEQAQTDQPASQLTMLRLRDLGWARGQPFLGERLQGRQFAETVIAPVDNASTDAPATNAPVADIPPSNLLPIAPAGGDPLPQSPTAAPNNTGSIPQGSQVPSHPGTSILEPDPTPAVIAEPAPLLAVAAVLPAVWWARRQRLRKS